MTTHDREAVIIAAKECYHQYSEWNVDIERFYAIAFESGAASRDAEVVSLTNQRDYEYVRAENAEQERDQLREQVKMLSAWIKQQGEITDTCTFHLLREVCENCACHRNKALAATEPTSIPTDT